MAARQIELGQVGFDGKADCAVGSTVGHGLSRCRIEDAHPRGLQGGVILVLCEVFGWWVGSNWRQLAAIGSNWRQAGGGRVASGLAGQVPPGY